MSMESTWHVHDRATAGQLRLAHYLGRPLAADSCRGTPRAGSHPQSFTCPGSTLDPILSIQNGDIIKVFVWNSYLSMRLRKRISLVRLAEARGVMCIPQRARLVLAWELAVLGLASTSLAL